MKAIRKVGFWWVQIFTQNNFFAKTFFSRRFSVFRRDDLSPRRWTLTAFSSGRAKRCGDLVDFWRSVRTLRRKFGRIRKTTWLLSKICKYFFSTNSSSETFHSFDFVSLIPCAFVSDMEIFWSWSPLRPFVSDYCLQTRCSSRRSSRNKSRPTLTPLLKLSAGTCTKNVTGVKSHQISTAKAPLWIFP